jgi:hypothetical protein
MGGMKAERVLDHAYERWDRRHYALTQSQNIAEHRYRVILLEQADALVQRLTRRVYGPRSATILRSDA